MNEVKLNRGVKALQVVAVISAVVNIYSVISALRILLMPDLSLGTTHTSILGLVLPSVGPALIVFVGSLVSAKELRAGKSWAWVAALGIFIMTLPSYCLPVSVLGLLSLLDREVREAFIAQLDFKI